MYALIQRVSQAQVDVDNNTIGKIGTGVLVFIGVQKDDTLANADKVINRLLNYRIFSDSDGKMNLNVVDIEGELLLVSQFTLAADTKSGTRAGFTTAKEPIEAEKIFNYLVDKIRTKYGRLATGQFGADMQVSLTNDGPVTFMLQG